MSGEQSQTAPAAASIRAAPDGTRHAGLLGVGAYRPVRVVPNDEISGKIDSSDEWIRSAPVLRPAGGPARARPSWP